MAGDMQPLKRRGRIVVSIVVWPLIAILIWGFFQWAWWLGVGVAAIAIWSTYDYIRKGGFATDIVEGLSREGRAVGEGATEVFGHDDE